MAATPSVPLDAPGASVRRPPWGMGDAAAAIVAAHIGGGLWGAMVIAAWGADQAAVAAQDLPSSLFFVAQLGLWALLIALPILVVRLKGRGPVADLRLAVRPLDIPVGLAVGVAAQLILVPLVSWPVIKLFDVDSGELSKSAQTLADRASSPGAVVLLFLGAALLAPFAEELMYRGLLLRSIEKRFGQVAAVVGSAVVFGAIHFQGLQFPALCAAGLVFALLAVRSGRLGPSIAAHVGFNLTTVAVLVWS